MTKKLSVFKIILYMNISMIWQSGKGPQSHVA